MPQKFHESLDELIGDVLKLSKLSQQMLSDAVDSLGDQDLEKANSVLANKNSIMEMDTDIEMRALRLIVLNQPMATDMRIVATILKIITYLTRIGRYGKDIAMLVEEMAKEDHLAKLVGIPDMAKRVCDMVEDAVNAFREKDLEKLDSLAERDDEIDAMRWSIFRECISYMMENPANITRCAHYMMIARYLERCGDHACKIGEKVHYMVTGNHIEIR